MTLTRRSFLQGAAAVAATPALAASRPAYLGARLDAEDRAFVGCFDESGRRLFEFALPARGHGFAQRGGEIVAFARRPGRFMVVADRTNGRVLHKVYAARNRRFCGHGAFNARGDLLYTTELDYDSGDGVIGVYDARYRRVGEFRSCGLDPHEILLMPDSETLVVANGGILTDPAAPGVKLNISEMDSSLVYLRARDGALLSREKLPGELFQLSLRHLATTPRGDVAVVMQYEGPQGDAVPLIAVQRRGHAFAAIDLPQTALRGLRNYCGSVAFDAAGEILAATSPVGGTTVLWDIAAERCIGAVEIKDGCGVSRGENAGQFLVTSGMGGAFSVQGASMEHIDAPYLDAGRWDNHLLRLR